MLAAFHIVARRLWGSLRAVAQGTTAEDSVIELVAPLWLWIANAAAARRRSSTTSGCVPVSSTVANGCARCSLTGSDPRTFAGLVRSVVGITS
ncbi:hypothetical protein ACIQU4_19230 [Streptomyces sp. NPDC090741]|uniref:hypothetical protein n=1 Tax=Streptomyces sp. NPDC090741 TaxID=3365967 RepID=UPI0037FD04A5